jgi:hypothetical protein
VGFLLCMCMVKSNIYKQFVELKEEIMRHKWIESEKANYDIGFEHALIDWVNKHRADWAKYKKEKLQ